MDSAVDQITQDILFDPQTSGGLLICLPETVAVELQNELRQEGIIHASIIGGVISGPEERIRIS